MMMHIRCPHCQNALEVVAESDLDNISCNSCGDSFSLVGEETATLEHSRRRTLAHFELTSQVGHGAFGAVWQARDTKLQRTVAIKIPRKDQLDSDEAENFLGEARAAAQLRHPNIVAVHEIGKDDGQIYIVSDFINGVTLTDWLSARRLDFRQSAELSGVIAGALHHAHESGVVHRDLKPSNIMMDNEGTPHVMDFGLAKRDAGEITVTVEGNIIGTPAYMSPEQAGGEGHKADCRSDVYSIGVILYRLLTNELPFRGNPRMLVMQILEDDPPAPRKLNGSIPRDLETICLKCLEKSPGKRYASAEDLRLELQRYLDDVPINARPIGRVARAWRWCKRKPAIAGLLATSLLLLLVGTIVSTCFAVRATREQRRAEKFREQEAEQRKLAEANFEKAHRMVDEFFVDVSESKELLRGSPGTQALRARLLERAAGYYERFITANQDDSDLQLDLARASRRLGELHHLAGKNDAAQHLQDAVSLYDRLASDVPDSVELQSDRADAHNSLGNYMLANKHYDEALRHYGTTLRTRQELLRDAPDNVEYGRGVASIRVNIALVYKRQNRVDESHKQMLLSVSELEPLYADHPKNGRVGYTLALTYFNLGTLEKERDAWTEAKSWYEKSLPVFESVRALDPSDAKALRLIAQSHIQLGNTAAQLGADLSQQLASFSKAVARYDQLVEENPSVDLWRHYRGLARAGLANVQRQQQHWSDAVQNFRLAAEEPAMIVSQSRIGFFQDKHLANLFALDHDLIVAGHFDLSAKLQEVLEWHLGKLYVKAAGEKDGPVEEAKLAILDGYAAGAELLRKAGREERCTDRYRQLVFTCQRSNSTIDVKKNVLAKELSFRERGGLGMGPLPLTETKKKALSSLYRRRAWRYAAHPDGSERNGELAVAYAKELLEILTTSETAAMAAAYAEVGDTEKAQEWAKKARDDALRSIEKHGKRTGFSTRSYRFALRVADVVLEGRKFRFGEDESGPHVPFRPRTAAPIKSQ